MLDSNNDYQYMLRKNKDYRQNGRIKSMEDLPSQTVEQKPMKATPVCDVSFESRLDKNLGYAHFVVDVQQKPTEK